MGEQLSVEERAARGKAERKKVPLESHADVGSSDTRDPVALLLTQAVGRVPALVPIRHGRMLVSPFTFYRGAAAIMAATTRLDAPRGGCCGNSVGSSLAPDVRLALI